MRPWIWRLGSFLLDLLLQGEAKGGETRIYRYWLSRVPHRRRAQLDALVEAVALLRGSCTYTLDPDGLLTASIRCSLPAHKLFDRLNF